MESLTRHCRSSETWYDSMKRTFSSHRTHTRRDEKRSSRRKDSFSLLTFYFTVDVNDGILSFIINGNFDT